MLLFIENNVEQCHQTREYGIFLVVDNRASGYYLSNEISIQSRYDAD